MTRRIIACSLALSMVFGSAAVLPQNVFTNSTSITASAAESFRWGDFEFIIKNDNTLELSEYFGQGGKAVIPESIDGRKVTSIGDCAFIVYSYENKKPITSVSIPETVTSIGVSAFSKCKLTDVSLPSKLTQIGAGAFSNCSELKSITIPQGVTNLKNDMFSECTSLKSVKLPSNLRIIEEYAFENCAELESIDIPKCVQSIGKYAFSICRKLEKIKIPDGVKELPEGVFSNCSGLKDMAIPSSVKKLGSYAFYDCRSIESLVLPEGITELPYSVFKDCNILKSIKLPNTLKNIGDSAFEDCNSLVSITLPNGLTSIGERAFLSSLKSVDIPKSVKELGDHAFGCRLCCDGKTDKLGYTTIDDYNMFCGTNSVAKSYAMSNNVNFVYRLAGSNRYSTAAQISKGMFRTARTVVIASGENYADALAGIPYARSINAPILLTNRDTLSADTLAEIKRLGAQNVKLLGGEGAVSDKVKKALEKNELSVTRISGKTRYATAVSVARMTGYEPEDVFFVVGNNYADALSISSAAAMRKSPIIYLPTDGELDTNTKVYLEQLKKKKCVKNAYVIGGKGVISDAMMAKASAALGVAAKRIAGSDRYSTCTEINKNFASLFTSGYICLATGSNFPDALADGVYAAHMLAPVILTSNKLTSAQTEYIKTKQICGTFVFGGFGAVPDSIAKSAATLSNKQ